MATVASKTVSKILDDFLAQYDLRASYPDENGNVLARTFFQLRKLCSDQLQSRVQAICPDPAKIRFEVGLIDNPEFNALAASVDGVDLIAINVGTIFLLRDIFDSILATPNCLTHIGDCSVERKREPYNAAAESYSFQTPDDFLRKFKPNDPARAKYASNLFFFSLYFIFNHEVGHVFNGHTDWLNQTIGLRALTEIGASAIAGLSGLDLQTLEMDADAFATQVLITQACWGQKSPSGDPYFPETLPLGSRKDTLFALFFTLYVVWPAPGLIDTRLS